MSFTFTDRFDYKDTPVADAFRRLRISNPFGLFNSSLQNSINPDDWEHIIEGTGSVNYLPFESAANLEVGTASGDRVLRQSIETFLYQTGTGMNVMMTGVLGAGKEGVASRIGVYDDLNGLFFEVRDGVLGVVCRRTLSEGNTEEIRIDQNDFNKDKLDGTGPSGYNIDISKAQLFSIDYAWLGVGRVRFSVWTGNCFCVVHEFNFNNILDTVYMGKGDLPCRYEILNIAATASPTSLKQICVAVFVEGGINQSGYSRAALTPAETTYNLPAGPAWYNLISIRIRANQPRVIVKLNSFHTLNDTNSEYQVAIIKNATLPTLTWDPISDFTEFALFGGAVTGGDIIVGDVSAARTDDELDLSLVRDRLALLYNNTSETFSLVARRIDGNSSLSAALNFIEFR